MDGIFRFFATLAGGVFHKATHYTVAEQDRGVPEVWKAWFWLVGSFFVWAGVSVAGVVPEPNQYFGPVFFATLALLWSVHYSVKAKGIKHGYTLRLRTVAPFFPGAGWTRAGAWLPVILLGLLFLSDFVLQARAYEATTSHQELNGDLKFLNWVLVAWLFFGFRSAAKKAVAVFEQERYAAEAVVDRFALVLGERPVNIAASIRVLGGDRFVLDPAPARALQTAVTDPASVDVSLAVQMPHLEMVGVQGHRIEFGPASAETNRRRAIRRETGGREGDRADERVTPSADASDTPIDIWAV